MDGRRWAEYNAAQADRDARPLARLAAETAGAARGRHAVELGCGIGREAMFLAHLGWSVHTFDADPSVAARVGAARGIEHTTARLQDLRELPPCELLLSCVALPYVPRDDFPVVWNAILRSLRPGGVLAVDLFGERDEWVGSDGTFLTRDEVDAMIAGLDVVSLVEEERDGRAFSGPKHWHTFELVARRREDSPGT